MRNATVIGGRGFIGAALAETLRRDGWDCVAVGRDDDWPLSGKPAGVVFYCAGLTADYLQRPFDTVDAHVSTLSRALQAHGLERLVYMSSTRLYDGIDPARKANEDCDFVVRPDNPRHLYDLTKLTGEALCHAVAPGSSVVVRLSGVYSESGQPDGFLGPLLDRIARTPRGGEIELDSSPHFSRDYIHLRDVLRIVRMVADEGRRRIYNVASGVNMRNDELAGLLLRRTGRRVVFLRDGSAPAHPVVDIEAVRNDFGFVPRNLEAALGDWFDQVA